MRFGDQKNDWASPRARIRLLCARLFWVQLLKIAKNVAFWCKMVHRGDAFSSGQAAGRGTQFFSRVWDFLQ
jgi:hypothetical protein